MGVSSMLAHPTDRGPPAAAVNKPVRQSLTPVPPAAKPKAEGEKSK